MNIEMHLKNKLLVMNKKTKKLGPVSLISLPFLPEIEIQDGICYWHYSKFYYEITETPEEIKKMFEQFQKEEDERIERARTKEWEDDFYRRTTADPVNN